MSKSEKLNLLSAHISKGLCERILTLSAAETAAMEDSDTQSEDDDASVSEDSESEDELLLEFGDASNSEKKIIQRTAKVKRKMSCLKGPG